VRPVTQINQIYGYLRVSTPEQVRSGVSLRQQENAIRKFVKEKYNRNVDEFFVDDGVSGTVPILDRAGSREMTDMIDRNDVVICTRLDRLSRDASNLLGLIPQLEEVGITLFFCEQFGDVPIVVPKPLENRGLKARFDMNDMANKIMLMVLSAVAEIEHANIKDRFAEGKCDWGARGYSIGGKTPYGFRVVEEEHGSKRRKFLEPIPEEQKVLETIYALHRRGRRAKRIAKELKGLHNVDFSFQKIDRILKRKIQGLPKVA
jgi:putative DNA-invertase from lambdoid prophage Rac